MNHRPVDMPRQRGVALAVSLVLLVAMSLLAISTLSGSRLSEQVASNAQQKAIAFEVAESAVEAGFDKAELLAALDLIPAAQSNDPDPIPRPALNAGLGVNFDQRRTRRDGTDVASVDIDGEVSIQYCGETSRFTGSDLNANTAEPQFTALLFDVNGVATVDSSATRADHVKRGYLMRVGTGRTGNCATRGVAGP